MKFSDLKITQSAYGTAILKNGELDVAQIAVNADDEMSGYEAEAREAAQLLKAFFEAKAAGKAVRLVVGNDKEAINDLIRAYNGDFTHKGAFLLLDHEVKNEGPTVAKMDTETGKELLDGMTTVGEPNVYERIRNRVAEKKQVEHERQARQQIGYWAALMQAQNPNFQIDACVTAAKHIWNKVQQIEI